MDAFLKWFGEQSNFVGSFQVVLDIALVLILLATLFFQNKKVKTSPGAEDLANSLGKIIEETKVIADEFESNLRERQILIQQLLSKVDQRVKEAQDLYARLDNLRRETLQPPPAQTQLQMQPQTPPQADYRKVVALAEKGLDAASIAKRLHKPVGEVELILNLQRLSGNR